MMYITFTHRRHRYAVGCETAADANLVYLQAVGVFDNVRINFSGRIGKDIVKLSEEEFHRMADEIIYNE